MLAVFRVASVILPMKCLQLPTILLTFIYFLFCKAPDPRTNRPRENEKRARKEESYLENEYLRAKRKNLRTPWSAAAIRRRRCGRAEKTQSTERHEEVGTSGCRCRSLATVCVSLRRSDNDNSWSRPPTLRTKTTKRHAGGMRLPLQREGSHHFASLD